MHAAGGASMPSRALLCRTATGLVGGDAAGAATAGEAAGAVALFGAGLFICIQLIYIVDFAHSWNESWVRNTTEPP